MRRYYHHFYEELLQKAPRTDTWVLFSFFLEEAEQKVWIDNLKLFPLKIIFILYSFYLFSSPPSVFCQRKALLDENMKVEGAQKSIHLVLQIFFSSRLLHSLQKKKKWNEDSRGQLRAKVKAEIAVTNIDDRMVFLFPFPVVFR